MKQISECPQLYIGGECLKMELAVKAETTETFNRTIMKRNDIYCIYENVCAMWAGRINGREAGQ